MTNSNRKSHGIAFSLLVAVLLAAGPAGAQPHCVGDCQGSGTVQINELIICVSISLGSRPVVDCNSCDSNLNGVVAINELIQAVNAALNGCPDDSTPTPAEETPTPAEATNTPVATDTPGGPTSTLTATPTSTQPVATATPTATQPAATATPNEVVEEVAGASAAVANSLSSVVNVVAAVVAGVSGGASPAAELSGVIGGGAGGDTDPCELGGTVFSDIQTVGLAANVTVIFTNCEIARPGGSVVFDGSLTVTGLNLQFRGNGAFEATIEFKDDQGQTSAITQADIQSPVALTTVAGGGDACAVDIPVLGSRLITGFDLTMLTGTLDSIVPNEGTARVEFLNTNVQLDISESDGECVPIAFQLLFDGNSQITQTSDAGSEIAETSGGTTVAFDLEFDSFLLSAVQTGDESLVTMTGDLIATCFGGTITLSTPEQLSFILGRFCPGDGVLGIEDIGDIVYSEEGVTANGMTFASCLDPALLTCTE